MRKFALLSLLALLGGIADAVAEIPYIVKHGFEEVDYDKLSPIEGFKLPDSGQFRDSTWVHGEDADHPRNPPSYTLMHDDKIIYDNNTKLMWERNLNLRVTKVVPPKGSAASRLRIMWRLRRLRRHQISTSRSPNRKILGFFAFQLTHFVYRSTDRQASGARRQGLRPRLSRSLEENDLLPLGAGRRRHHLQGYRTRLRPCARSFSPS